MDLATKKFPRALRARTPHLKILDLSLLLLYTQKGKLYKLVGIGTSSFVLYREVFFIRRNVVVQTIRVVKSVDVASLR